MTRDYLRGVPDASWLDPVMHAKLHTGHNAVVAAAHMPSGVVLATDIETPGLLDTFTLNCVTAAWQHTDGMTHAVLLDPRRTHGHRAAVADMYERASAIVLHNAPFDVPPLHHAGMLSLDLIDRVVDTIVLARFAFPDSYGPMGPKKLENLAVRLLGMTEFKGGMELAFKAAGYKTQQAGYEGMDIDAPVYRLGAMADTVATLRLESILRQRCIEHTLDHPFVDHGATTETEAEATLHVQETVHRVMLRRSAVGLAVDLDYLERYQEDVADARQHHTAELAKAGLEGGSGKGYSIVDYLAGVGQLPADWPRTPTGKWRATKDDLDTLDHPLATAQRGLAYTDKIMGYLAKVTAQAKVTGRCHPMVGTLGASATGRTSYSSPELQQFPPEARPVLMSDGDGVRQQLWSIDWSQIEPVVMGLMAHDTGFLAPYEAGEDLYEPLMRAAGIDRKTSKLVLLATMYGQGTRSMAARIGHTEESAAQVRRQIMSAMPMCERWMATVEAVATNYGKVVSAGGRILPVDSDGAFRAVNYAVQSSAYDVLAHTIFEMKRRGMADSIALSMHDEIVVDCDDDTAREVEQIMLTPPPFLVKWAGRMPILRCDRQPMGKAWASV